MKGLLRLYASGVYWRKPFSLSRTGKALLSAFGVLWLIVEITAFFSPGAETGLSDSWPAFLIAGLLWAFWENRPLVSVRQHLPGRDVSVGIAIGDIFENSGAALIIGTNTSFDTELSQGLINARSVQGQFTSKYYDEVAYLDQDIEPGLRNEEHFSAPEGKPGKDVLYQIGTVVQVQPRSQTAYLVAIAEINAHGTAQSSMEAIREALARLWEFIGTRGTIEHLVTPVLGSGFSRITAPREQLIREIVQSFVAACSERQFCEDLTIVIPAADYAAHNINLEELDGFLQYVCRYTPQRPAQQAAIGTPVSALSTGRQRLKSGGN